MNYTLVLSKNNQFHLCLIDEVVQRSHQNKLNQQLLEACKLGLGEKVVELINIQGADLHLANTEVFLKFNPEGNSPLHIAAANGYNDIVEYLISAGSNVNCSNKRLAAPIHVAVFRGRYDTVKLLLDKGASIEAREDEGDTPLAWASYTGYSNIVELLIEYGADIHNKNNFNYTPLHWACYIGHLSAVQTLVKYNANIQIQNAYGETPICCALSCGRDDVYLFLIKKQSKHRGFRVIGNDQSNANF